MPNLAIPVVGECSAESSESSAHAYTQRPAANNFTLFDAIHAFIKSRRVNLENRRLMRIKQRLHARQIGANQCRQFG